MRAEMLASGELDEETKKKALERAQKRKEDRKEEEKKVKEELAARGMDGGFWGAVTGGTIKFLLSVETVTIWIWDWRF
jgi:hypothetical protein